jgi:ATP-binding cassette subfamily F protein 3
VILAHYDASTPRQLFNTWATSENAEADHVPPGAFGFGGTRAQQGVASLSGGERARLHLLAVLLAHANVLLLDEPTNHLDTQAVDMLRESLQSFKGTVILVSHDEEFLSAIADQTWAVAGGKVRAAAHYDPRLLIVPAAKAPKPAAARATTPVPSSKPLKAPVVQEKRAMSKNERFRAEKRKVDADALVAKLSAEKATMEKRFSDPNAVFSEDWRALHEQFEKLKKRLESAEEEWLEATNALDEDDALRGGC